MNRIRALRKPREESYIDYSLIFIILFLLAFGLVMVYSTSSYEANLDLGDSSYYFRHQMVSTIIGLAAMMIVSYIPYRFIAKFAFPIYIAAAVLLILIIPFGKRLNGAKRWIYIMGMSVQPAEVAKFAVIVFSAVLIIKLRKNLMSSIRRCIIR